MRGAEQNLSWVLYIGIFAVLFVPLYVASWAFFPYIVGKAILFRVIVEILFATWLLLVALGEAPRPKLTPLFLGVTAFVVIVGLADALGVAPLKSFWSNFERMEGFITILHAYVFFIVVGSTLRTEKVWNRFWLTSLSVSVFVGLSGLAEIPNGVERVAGTTGNPIYLAVYTLFHIFIAFILMRRLKGWVIPLAILALFNLLVLWFTGTRGALLGLLAGISFTAFVIAVLGREKVGMQLYRVSLGLMVGLLVLVGSFFMIRNTAFVQESSMLSRFANISLATDGETRDTSSLRLMVWSIAMEGIKERPLLGWGQENFNYVFNKYYNPHMYWAEPWYDRTHNIIFDWLIAGGILGLLGYLGMYVLLIVGIWRSTVFDFTEKALALGLLAAYGVHNLFVFDHLISYIVFFAFMAWVHNMSVGKEETLSFSLLRDKTVRAVLMIAVGVGASTAVYFINYGPYIQNRTLMEASILSGNGRITESREAFLSAVSEGPLGIQEIRERFATTASRLASAEGVSAEVKQAFANDALKEMQAQMVSYPEDARFPYFTATLLGAYGQYESAQVFYEKALALSPTKPEFLVNTAINLIQLRRVSEARALLRKAEELDSTNPQPKSVLEQLIQADIPN